MSFGIYRFCGFLESPRLTSFFITTSLSLAGLHIFFSTIGSSAPRRMLVGTEHTTRFSVANYTNLERERERETGAKRTWVYMKVYARRRNEDKAELIRVQHKNSQNLPKNRDFFEQLLEPIFAIFSAVFLSRTTKCLNDVIWNSKKPCFSKCWVFNHVVYFGIFGDTLREENEIFCFFLIAFPAGKQEFSFPRRKFSY